MERRARPWRLRAPLRTICVLALGLALGFTPAPSAAAGSPSTSKVERSVLDQATSAGTATFFVELRERADLSGVNTRRTVANRAGFVYQQLTATASRSQQGLRQLLSARGVGFEPFWIANVVLVTGDEALLSEIASRPEVVRIVPNRTYQIPTPTPAEAQAQIDAVEWNISRIRADQVWTTFGKRGEGIVVANIDTGVQFDHPALVRQYRGNTGTGFDHNFNWFDPTGTCTTAPCDNNGHGTHTMGTMVGDDGAGNQIGVAPGAKWIAAKGCATNNCTNAALLSAGQWVVAPTDLNGQNPRPDLAPNVVNNSWGGGPDDTFYQQTVNNWVAAGIFPAFANGNAGSACNTAGSPGDYPQSYAVGAFDMNNTIASFSSRGPGMGTEIKPNISAPGVAVRSSFPTNSFNTLSGTSMATPHVAGSVALLWSVVPSLKGNIAQTRSVFDGTAIDVNDTTCGGTAADNNVWGEGRLDVFAAVSSAAGGGQTGSISGTVTSGGQPVAGTTVTLNPGARTAVTAANGTYTFTGVAFGSYTLSAGGTLCLGATSQSVTVNGAVTANISLPARSDSFGNTCVDGTGTFVPTSAVLGLTGDDASRQVTLPFAFRLYGTSFTSAFVSTNGLLSFPAANTAFTNTAVPSTAAPNATVYPYWDDLFVDASASILTATVGTAPNRQFVIEWRNVRYFNDTTRRVSFQVVLNENSSLTLLYAGIAADAREQGNSATVGIENGAGTVALQYSFNQATLSSGKAITFRPPA